MKHLSLAQRLGLGFAAVLVLLAAVATLGVHRLSVIHDALSDITEVNNQESRLAVRMRIAVNQVATVSRNIILLTDADGMAFELTRLKKSRADYDQARTQLKRLFDTEAGTTAQERALLAQIDQWQGKTRPVVDRVVALGLQNDAEQATRVLLTEVRPPQNEWLKSLGELADLEESLTQQAAAQAERTYASGRALLLGGSLMALLVGIGMGVWITRGILRELGGEPAYAAAVVTRIAAGDLSLPVQVRAGDQSSLLAAMRHMQGALLELVQGIRAGSEHIATASAQIATGNADLSQRTEEQASNLQQTAASMEQLNATVLSNTETARQVTQLASAASEVAAQGGQVVGQVVSTMNDITLSSRRIADIIGTIDGIAFQTNILALNAAVEAARAGDEGRGFAVVAGEVRSLASRSAEAAREIKTLIGASVEKVETGVTLVADAGRTMDDIVRQVRGVSELIASITSATLEQTQGIGQVNDAVTQLDHVTQQNAALVEESAAAAESLRSHADRLVGSVAVFKTAALA